MKKIELLALISSHKKDEAKTELEEERLALLEDFLLTPDIQALKEDDDVSFDMFLKHASSAFPQLLPVLTFIAKLDEPFKKFIVSSRGDFLESLPKELQDIIVGMLGKKELGRVSRTSSTLHYQTKGPSLWRGPMIEAGCSPALFDELVSLNLVTDYQNLCRAYRQIVRTDREFLEIPSFRPNQLWQLLCLSGETKAIQHALTLLNGDMHALDRKSLRPRYFLEYLIHSGRPEAIDFVQTMEFNFHPKYDPSRWLDVAIQTGRMTIIERISRNEITNEFTLRLSLCQSSRTFTLLDPAFLSGNIHVVNYVLDLYAKLALDAKKENAGGFFFLRSLHSGSLPVVKRALELRSQGFQPVLDDGTANFLEWAARSGDIDVFDLILNHCDEFHIDPTQSHLLHFAVLSGSRAMVDHVSAYCTKHNIDQKTGLDRLENVCGNIVHFAFASSKDISFTQHVIDLGKKLGIELSATDYAGRNIIQAAALGKNPVMITFARQLGADLQPPITPQTTDAQGHDAFYYAQPYQHVIDALTRPLPERVIRPLPGVNQ